MTKRMESYKQLKEPILKVLKENSPMLYTHLYNCVKYKLTCTCEDGSCGYRTDDGSCLKNYRLCEYCKKDWSCSKQDKTCRYYDGKGFCLQKSELCDFCEIGKVHSKESYKKCVDYLIYAGEIVRTEIKTKRGLKRVNLKIKDDKCTQVDEKSNVDTDFNCGFKYLNTWEKVVFHGKGSPYFYEIDEKIKVRKASLIKLHEKIEYESPFGFEATHFKEIVYSVVDLLRGILFELYRYSGEKDQKVALDKFEAFLESYQIGFLKLSLLVDPPLKMSFETCEVIGKSFDYAYKSFLYSNEFGDKFLEIDIENLSTKGFKKLNPAVVDSTVTYLDRIGPILKILNNSSPIQYKKLYEELVNETGARVSKGTFKKCLDYLIFSGIIDQREVKGQGKGKQIQISIKNNLHSSSYYDNMKTDWYMEKLLEELKNEPHSIIEANHYRIIWTFLYSTLKMLVYELAEYSNEESQRVSHEHYQVFLKTQLIPSFMNLSKLVNPPFKMSVETLEILKEILDCTNYVTNKEVKHSFNDVTQEEARAISDILKDVKPSHQYGRESTHFNFEGVAEDVENRIQSEGCLKIIRCGYECGISKGSGTESSYLDQPSDVVLDVRVIEGIIALKKAGVKTAPIAENLGISVRRVQQILKAYRETGEVPRVDGNPGRTKKILSDEEKRLIDEAYSEHKAGACSLERIIESKYDYKIPHNAIHNYLLSRNLAKRRGQNHRTDSVNV